MIDGKPALVKPVWEMEDKKDDDKPIQDEGEDGKPVVDDKGKPVYVQTEKKDKDGNKIPVYETEDKGEKIQKMEPVDKASYPYPISKKGGKETRQYFSSAWDVVKPHGIFYIIVQAGIAILILVGFESVTSMGEEAKDPKRHIPKAVLLSLFIQGLVCYLIEYFCANFFLNNNYKMTDAASSSAPIADMMQLVGAWLFGSPNAGWWFMMVEALTVFLALIGTTLSCMNTGARVTYAMGRDDEVPSHFGMLHGKNLTPHRAIWTLAAVSALIGIVGVLFYACGPFVSDVDAYKGWVSDIGEKNNNIWYSFGIFKAETAKSIPNSLLIIALTSNFGTFMLYMLTNVAAIVAFREHHTFNGFKHMVVPVFGIVANFLCMLFYLVGPIPGIVEGMSWKESYLALAVAAVWGIYGYWYFVSSSKAKGRTTLVGKPVANDSMLVGQAK